MLETDLSTFRIESTPKRTFVLSYLYLSIFSRPFTTLAIDAFYISICYFFFLFFLLIKDYFLNNLMPRMLSPSHRIPWATAILSFRVAGWQQHPWQHPGRAVSATCLPSFLVCLWIVLFKCLFMYFAASLLYLLVVSSQM